MPSYFGAAAGGRLGRVRLSPWDVWGEGKDTFPSPSHPFHPEVREVGVGSNGGLWLELDRGGGAEISAGGVRPSHRREALCPRGGRKEAVGARLGAH